MKYLVIITVIVFNSMLIQAQSDITLNMSMDTVRTILGEPDILLAHNKIDSTLITVFIYSDNIKYYRCEFHDHILFKIDQNPTIAVVTKSQSEYPHYRYETPRQYRANSYKRLYNTPYKKSMNQITVGKTFFWGGLLTAMLGGVILGNSKSTESASIGSTMIVIGGTLNIIGIPIWISGVDKKHTLK